MKKNVFSNKKNAKHNVFEKNKGYNLSMK